MIAVEENNCSLFINVNRSTENDDNNMQLERKNAIVENLVDWVEFYFKLPQLCRQLVVQFIVQPQLHLTADESLSMCVVKDTVNVWMGADIMERRNRGEKVAITYHNWGNHYDEVIDVAGDRFQLWVEPSRLAWLSRHEWHVSKAELARWTRYWQHVYRKSDEN